MNEEHKNLAGATVVAIVLSVIVVAVFVWPHLDLSGHVSGYVGRFAPGPMAFAAVMLTLLTVAIVGALASWRDLIP